MITKVNRGNLTADHIFEVL